MIIRFIGVRSHEATLQEDGLLWCMCGRLFEYTTSADRAYAMLEMHIRRELNHQGALVRA